MIGMEIAPILFESKDDDAFFFPLPSRKDFPDVSCLLNILSHTCFDSCVVDDIFTLSKYLVIA